MLTSFNESRIGLMYEDEDSPEKGYSPVQHKRSSPLSYASLWAIVLIQTVVIMVVLGLYRHARATCGRQLHLYSPAEDVVKYEVKTYSLIDGDIFQRDPSPEVDKAWEDLYKNSTSRIPRSIAERLPNKTSEIYGDPDGYYIVGLEVFHQLHCLDRIRQTLYSTSDYLPEMSIIHPGNKWHMRHCLNTLRQSMMCTGDIHPIVWQWDEEERNTVFRLDVAHKCRNWDAINEWANDHARVTELDTSVRMDNDIQVPIYRADGSTYLP